MRRNRSPLALDPADLAVCQALHKAHGTSYYWATAFFPKDLRTATHVLYAFFRAPDEIVDNPTGNPVQELSTWKHDWKKAYRTGISEHPVLRAAAQVFRTYQIPESEGEAFLKAMEQDLVQTKYPTFHELRGYMYGSAAVVGRMMTRMMGVHDERVLAYAELLGEAMQLTNFLRDVGEDYRLRQRIYLPQDEMRAANITENDIKHGVVTDAWRAFMRQQIIRARKRFAVATLGIHYLPKRARLAVYIAASLYAAILTEIEHADYNVFVNRARVSTRKKIVLISKVCLFHARQSLLAQELADLPSAQSLLDKDVA